MDDKTKNKIGGTIITGALISGGMGFLVAIFLSEPWHSYIGMIIRHDYWFCYRRGWLFVVAYESKKKKVASI